MKRTSCVIGAALALSVTALPAAQAAPLAHSTHTVVVQESRGGGSGGGGGGGGDTTTPGCGGFNFLSLFGLAAKTCHHSVENIISGLGLAPLTSHFDHTVVHPLLWTPISKLTGVDVDTHPDH